MYKYSLPGVAISVVAVFFLLACDAGPETRPYNNNSLVDCSTVDEEAPASFIFRDGNLIMNGVIGSGTPAVLARALRKHRRAKTIVMQCVPGSEDDEANLVAGRMVRHAGLDTHVASGGEIASGGVDFFIAGVRRSMGDDVYAGVHAWGAEPDEPQARILPRDHAEHQPYLQYYKKMDIPAEFYWFTLRVAGPDGMHNMTDAELKKYRILTD